MVFVIPLQCEHFCLVNSGTTGGIIPGMRWENDGSSTSAIVPDMSWGQDSDWSEYERQ